MSLFAVFARIAAFGLFGLSCVRVPMCVVLCASLYVRRAMFVVLCSSDVGSGVAKMRFARVISVALVAKCWLHAGEL